MRETEPAMIHYDRVNNGRRELVLVHGFLGGTGYWKPLFPSLKEHFGLIAVDLPGFAGSASIPAPDSIAGLSQALVELMDSLGVERFSLLGFSMGGMVAMQTALEHGDRLENLILYGTAASGTLPNRFESWDTSIARMQEQGVEATADRTVSTWFVDGERHPYYSACREACRGASQESCIKLMRAMQRWSATERLNEIKIPSLLIVGDKDRSTKPSESIAIWERIPGSQLCILPNGAHGVHMEKPHLFSKIIVDFLSRT